MQRWGWLDKTCGKIFLNEFLQSLLFRCWKRVYRTNQRLSTLFQIDFEVIRMMRRENFSSCLAKNVGKFMILRRNIGEIRSFCKFCRVSLNVRRTKTDLKLWEPGSFDARKNAAVPMIAMLGRLELDTEVSDIGIETTKSNDCRGVSKKNRDTNSVLATTREGVRFSCKDGWKFIDPFT